MDEPAHDLTEKLKRSHDDYASRGAAEGKGEEDGLGFDALATRLYATLGIDHGVVCSRVCRPAFVDGHVASCHSSRAMK